MCADIVIEIWNKQPKKAITANQQCGVIKCIDQDLIMQLQNFINDIVLRHYFAQYENDISKMILD